MKRSYLERLHAQVSDKTFEKILSDIQGVYPRHTTLSEIANRTCVNYVQTSCAVRAMEIEREIVRAKSPLDGKTILIRYKD